MLYLRMFSIVRNRLQGTHVMFLGKSVARKWGNLTVFALEEDIREGIEVQENPYVLACEGDSNGRFWRKQIHDR